MGTRWGFKSKAGILNEQVGSRRLPKNQQRKLRTTLSLESLEARLVLAAPVPLPGDQMVSLAAGDQTSPVIASGAGTLLAVWSDSRANVTGDYEGETSRDLYGMRISAAGNVLDSVPIALVADKATQDHPKVSWNGTNWLVVYETNDLGGTGYYQKALEAIRVAPSGQVLDAEPIRLFGLTPIAGGFWNVASDGNNWVVVNDGTSASNDMVAVRVSSAGSVLDPPTRTLVDGTYYARSNLQLAYADGIFLLTYNDQFSIGYATNVVRFDSSLSVLSTVPEGFLTEAVTSLASNGTEFYAVWNQQLLDFSTAVYGSRVDRNGTLLDGAGINISLTNEAQTFESPIEVDWDGIGWKVNWTSGFEVRTARITTAGMNLDPGGVALAGLHGGPGAGTGNGDVQMVWSSFANNNWDVYSAKISAGNSAGPIQPLSVGTPQQLRPDMATSGTGTMIVYHSATSAGSRILAQPLDAAGQASTTEPIELAASTTDALGKPAVAWNGLSYMVAWSTSSGIVGQRLDAQGTKIDLVPNLVLSTGFGSAHVAALGSDFLVTGLKVGIAPRFVFPIAARVRGTDGAVLDSTPMALGASYLRSAPQVVALGGRWFVAWHANTALSESIAFTRGAFVNPDGTFTPQFEIHGPFSTAGGNGSFEIGLASNGVEALLVQSQELTSGVETDLLAHRIHSDGSVTPIVNLTPWSGNQYKPRVTWDGEHFIVVYHDQKARVAPYDFDQLDARSDIYAMRVSPSGGIVDPQGFQFSALPIGETDPSIVSGGNGITVVAASHLMNDPIHANYRVVYKQLNSNNQWPVAVANADIVDGDVPLAVNFSSSGSTDVDGSVASYSWDFGNGVISAQENPSFVFTIPGRYPVQLTVTDNLGGQTVQAIMIQATAPNEIPIAVVNASVSSGTAPLNVGFNADGSYDPDGVVGNIEWTISDGTTYFGSYASHTFNIPGDYDVAIRVYDARGGVGTSSLQIHVDGNLPGDFDGNGQLDPLDVDSLSAAIVIGSLNQAYDVTGDGVLDVLDLEHWVLNLKQTLLGDTDLDFVVDGHDFNIWNSHKFTVTSAWTHGDFNADGVVDVSDFGTWNANKFGSANRPTPGSLFVTANALVEPVPLRQSELTLIDRVWSREGENRSTPSRVERDAPRSARLLQHQRAREFPANKGTTRASAVFAEWGIAPDLDGHFNAALSQVRGLN